MIRLANFFNKTLLVCIPSIFEDQQPRPFKLVGIEEQGLWLESPELAETLQCHERIRSPDGAMAVFFPFSHIAYVMPEAHPLALVPRPPMHVEKRESKSTHSDESPKVPRPQKHPSRQKGRK